MFKCRQFFTFVFTLKLFYLSVAIKAVYQITENELKNSKSKKIKSIIFLYVNTIYI